MAEKMLDHRLRWFLNICAGISHFITLVTLAVI